jgi:hypothetical protein
MGAPSGLIAVLSRPPSCVVYYKLAVLRNIAMPLGFTKTRDDKFLEIARNYRAL